MFGVSSSSNNLCTSAYNCCQLRPLVPAHFIETPRFLRPMYFPPVASFASPNALHIREEPTIHTL